MDWSNFKFNFRSKQKQPRERDKRTDSLDSDSRPPAHEVLQSEAVTDLATEPISLEGGLTLLKSVIPSSVGEELGSSESDLLPGKYEGGLKLWECTIDLVETLRREVQDGRLSFRGKDVLELGCGHGLPGILACIKGAHHVDFQDFNAEVLLSVTIPNVTANLAHARSRVPRTSEIWIRPSLTPSLSRRSMLQQLETHFYAGDWADMNGLLSFVDESLQILPAAHGREAFHPVSEEENLQAVKEAGSARVSDGGSRRASSDPGSGTRAASEAGPEERDRAPHQHHQEQEQQPTFPEEHPAENQLPSLDQPQRQGLQPPHMVDLPGSVSFSLPLDGQEEANGRGDEHVGAGSGGPPPDVRGQLVDGQQLGGYDIILMSETVYNPTSLVKLRDLIKKCLRAPHGVLYVAGKKFYFGVGGGMRQFKTLMEEEGVIGGHMLSELVDGKSNVREIWKFFFKGHHHHHQRANK